MSSNIDMSKWPLAWKKQYNSALRERKLLKLQKLQREQERDRDLYPQIWKLEMDEEAVFSFLAHSFPLEEVLTKLLSKFVSDTKKDVLKLSWSYLFDTQGISPAHYSDRERLVVLLNRFKSPGRDWEKFFQWLSYFSEKSEHPYTHLLLGMMFLDHYLRNLSQGIWLDKAIKHLFMVGSKLEREESKLALKALMAFCFYLQQDFSKSLSYLPAQGKTFEEDFKNLIKKVA